MIGRSIDLSFDGMTVGALDRRRLILVRNLTNVRVTGSAKVPSMDRVGVFRGIDLIVTSKTILVLDLLRSAEAARTQDRGQHETKE